MYAYNKSRRSRTLHIRPPPPSPGDLKRRNQPYIVQCFSFSGGVKSVYLNVRISSRFNTTYSCAEYTCILSRCHLVLEIKKKNGHRREQRFSILKRRLRSEKFQIGLNRKTFIVPNLEFYWNVRILKLDIFTRRCSLCYYYSYGN